MLIDKRPENVLTKFWSLVDKIEVIVNLLQKSPAVILHCPAVI